MIAVKNKQVENFSTYFHEETVKQPRSDCPYSSGNDCGRPSHSREWKKGVGQYVRRQFEGNFLCEGGSQGEQVGSAEQRDVPLSLWGARESSLAWESTTWDRGSDVAAAIGCSSRGTQNWLHFAVEDGWKGNSNVVVGFFLLKLEIYSVWK